MLTQLVQRTMTIVYVDAYIGRIEDNHVHYTLAVGAVRDLMDMGLLRKTSILRRLERNFNHVRARNPPTPYLKCTRQLNDSKNYYQKSRAEHRRCREILRVTHLDFLYACNS